MTEQATPLTVRLLGRMFGPELAAWQGRAPLARVFWVYGVLTSLGLGGLFLMAGQAGRRDIQQGLIVALSAYTVFILVALWRCSEAAAPGVRLLVRLLTLAWAVNAMMLAAFVQLDLIATWLRG